MEPSVNKKLTYNEMLNKLDELYSQKELLEEKLLQLQYDIEFLENMIMYKYVKTTPNSNVNNNSTFGDKKKEWLH